MEAKGSITVFSAVSFILVVSFLFVLLEAGRVYGLDTCAGLKTELGLESVCAEYQTGLWKSYHLLGVDGAYGGDEFSMEYVTKVLRKRISDNLYAGTGGRRGMQLFHLDLTEAAPDTWQLMTDGEGAVFMQQAAAYMKKSLPRELAEGIYEKYTQGREVDQSRSPEYSIEDADFVIKDAMEKQSEVSEEELKGQSEEIKIKENPLEIALELKRNAVLGMVLGDISEISTKEIGASDGLLGRTCERGNSKTRENVEWYDRILVLEYMDKYFLDYIDEPEGHVLSYEMEYVLCGKESDKANLEEVVGRLLLLREAANVTHIISNREKMNEASMLASALAGFTGNMAIIRIVQIGIVAAWAYMESIQDVRALLKGDRIALIKNQQQWTVDTGNLLESFSTTAKAKNCENGFTYQDYLKQFLFFTKIKELSYRMMDVMEQNIRLVPQYKNFRMDHVINSLSYSVKYEASPVFFRLSRKGNLRSGVYSFYKTSHFSYF